MAYESWGRSIASTPSAVVPLPFPPSSLPDDDLLLPYGLGRSYGDVCLNNGHTLLDVSKMDHFRRFDADSGVIEVEAGASLDAILRVVVPRGWFLPVTPGTKFVTVGGCIANDVHGKNHHRAGTLGRHVRSLELLRSDGRLIRCAPGDDLFRATIGGLGLTGLIVSAEVSLRKIESPMIVAEKIPFRTLAEFDDLSRSSDATHDYSVAWFEYSTSKFTGWPTPSNQYDVGQPEGPQDEYTILHQRELVRDHAVVVPLDGGAPARLRSVGRDRQ